MIHRRRFCRAPRRFTSSRCVERSDVETLQFRLATASFSLDSDLSVNSLRLPCLYNFVDTSLLACLSFSETASGLIAIYPTTISCHSPPRWGLSNACLRVSYGLPWKASCYVLTLCRARDLRRDPPPRAALCPPQKSQRFLQRYGLRRRRICSENKQDEAADIEQNELEFQEH